MSVVTVVSPKSLADLLQLRFHVLDIEKAELGQNGAIEEEVRLVPSPSEGRNRSFSSECGRGLVPFVCVWLDEDIARQKQIVVCLSRVGLGKVIIRRDGGRNPVNMRSKSLVVFRLGKNLVLAQGRLDVLCPSLLAKSLGLCDARCSVLGCIRPGGCQNLLVDRLIVWPSKLYIGSCVGIIVRLEMRRNGVFELEVWLADPRRIIAAFVEGGRTPEEDGQDGVPGEQAVVDVELVLPHEGNKEEEGKNE